MMTIVRYCILVSSALWLFGCATSEIIQTSRNEVMISTSAAPACGKQGALRVAQQMAAVATLRNGFKRFLIGVAGASSDINVVQGSSTTTGTFTTVGGTTYGNMQTTSYPIYFGSHDAQLRVLMLNPGDDGYENALDAKQALGPEWTKKVDKGIQTCTNDADVYGSDFQDADTSVSDSDVESMEARLEEIKQLRNENLITDEEYRSLKMELLSDL